MKTFAVEEAKQFLKNRILDQAAIDNIALSKAEIAMLTYSEPSATESQHRLADEVDTDIGSDEYEHKISTLLLHSYERDVERGAKDEWKKHLNALRDEDLYLLVMVENAGISGAPISIPSPTNLSKDTKELAKYLLKIDIFCLAAFAIGGGLLLLHVAPSLSSGWARLGLCAIWLAVLWLIGEWSRRRTFRDWQ